MCHQRSRHPFSKSMPISNRLYTKKSLILQMPTSPESDGEIYLTPNTSVSVDDDKNGDSGLDENQVVYRRVVPPPRTKNGYRIDKIRSMSSISNKNNEAIAEDQVDSGMDEKFSTPETQNGHIYRMNSLGNLSQYEREFGSTPKTLLKLKEDFENRRQAILAQRKSLTNLLENNNEIDNQINSTQHIIKKDNFFKKPTLLTGKYKKRIGIGDTKYIGTDNDTPEPKQYHLTKMKSLGTIPDSMINEKINCDPFLTPMIPRRHPASLHSFEEETHHNDVNSDSNGSSDLEEQENFLRHQPDEHVRFMNEIGLLKGSFERGFRRSYNRKHDRTSKPMTPLRQSDGYFQMPHLPVAKHTIRPNSTSVVEQPKNRSSVHSLPSEGKFDGSRYESIVIEIDNLI